jgi:hypothetical protein
MACRRLRGGVIVGPEARLLHPRGMLIDTIRVEVAALITTPAQDLGIPAQHR